MTIVSSPWIAMRLYAIIQASLIGFLILSTAFVRWILQDEQSIARFPNAVAWALSMLELVVLLQTIAPMFAASYVCYRLCSWHISDEGIEGRFLGRRRFWYPWDEIFFVVVMGSGGLILRTTSWRKHYLAFADPQAARAFIPFQKQFLIG